MTAHLSPKIAPLRANLLAWYHAHKRDLPWRGERSAYRIWVSEVMLQQTQVLTVTPYYHAFVARFPTLADLAAASREEVLKAWEGLGYYNRAHNLHLAAGEVMEKHAGQVPERYIELRQLPGLGDYTAGAVASIAFGEAVPALDVNAKRVLARVFAIQTQLNLSPAVGQLKEIAAALVPPATPGDWNQALIELGATLCTPKSPNCAACPIQSFCQGFALGLQQSLPVKPARKPLPHYNVAAAVIREGKQILIAQRPPGGMLGGLWEFPGGKQEAGETLPECLRREIQEELGIEIEVGELLVTVKHSYTHFKITLHAFECRRLEGEPQTLGVADWRWVTPEEFADLPFPRTDLKIIEAMCQKIQGEPQ
jgi:A/G-specific adenine glycosylase